MRTRDQRLLWDGVRLAVLDIETVWDPGGFAGLAREETDRAIEAVRQTGQPVRLAPQPRKVRWRQHATIEAAGLTSMSHGQDPKRAVEVRPRPDALPVVPPGPLPPGGEARAAWIAIVECERGTVGATWQSLVNPGVPVDPVTGSIHRLTDEQLRDAPPFASLADELVRLLTPAPGELLVLAGHNLGYDIGVLRAEMRRVGKELPDLPILDTMGHFAARVGKQAGLSLLDLLAELSLPAPQPHHSATEDARATAAAACRLLDLAADAGDFDMPTLLGELGTQTVLTLPVVLPSARATKPVRAARAIPDDHAIAHVPLSPEPEPDEISQWITLVEECAALRCPDLATSATSVVARSIESLLPGRRPPSCLARSLAPPRRELLPVTARGRRRCSTRWASSSICCVRCRFQATRCPTRSRASRPSPSGTGSARSSMPCRAVTSATAARAAGRDARADGTNSRRVWHRRSRTCAGRTGGWRRATRSTTGWPPMVARAGSAIARRGHVWAGRCAARSPVPSSPTRR